MGDYLGERISGSDAGSRYFHLALVDYSVDIANTLIMMALIWEQ
jgi:hypothetical protein